MVLTSAFDLARSVLLQTLPLKLSRPGICTSVVKLTADKRTSLNILHAYAAKCCTWPAADVDDLEGGGTYLDTGQVCQLPLIPLEGKSCAVQDQTSKASIQRSLWQTQPEHNNLCRYSLDARGYVALEAHEAARPHEAAAGLARCFSIHQTHCCCES